MKSIKHIKRIFLVAIFSGLTFNTYGDNFSSTSTLSVDDIIANMLLKNTIGLRYGAPSNKQILPINTKEVYFQHRFNPFSGSLVTPALEFSVSQLNVGEEKGYVYGLGPAFSIPIGGSNGGLHFQAHGKMHYLTRDDFGRKRYGGPIHWTYGFGVRTNITINTFASYMWQHMSNGDVYEYNPALETHTVTLGINF